MNNNEIMIELRDNLNMETMDMVEIFNLGDFEITEAELLKMFKVTEYSSVEETSAAVAMGEYLKCDDVALESFLNGFIILKRGKQEPKEGQSEKPPLAIKSRKSVNNVMLKKLKIAFSLTNDDMVDLFKESGIYVSKGDLTTFFRKEGHKHYKRCSDEYLKGFLKGLATQNK
jgi:uncharacterized protein YehS (DUF1456 family)